jgi:hypothetical protein
LECERQQAQAVRDIQAALAQQYQLKYKNGRKTLADILKSCERKLNVPVYNSRRFSDYHLDAAHMWSIMSISVWETWM